MTNRAAGVQAVKRVLRPVRNTASQALYGNAKRYKLRLDGRLTTFSTEQPVAHRWFYPRYAFNRLHEKPMTLRLLDDLRRSHCFVDVGANLGYYTCLAATHMKAGEVHAFEMDSDNFAMLTQNVALNPTSIDVSTNNCAVGAATGTLTYTLPSTGNSPALSVYPLEHESGESSVSVPAVSLADYFVGRTVQPDLVKIDVEGAEVDVLRGMVPLLPDIERIYLEVHPENLRIAGQSPHDALSILADHFDLFEISGHRSQRNKPLTRISADTELLGNAAVLASK